MWSSVSTRQIICEFVTLQHRYCVCFGIKCAKALCADHTAMNVPGINHEIHSAVSTRLDGGRLGWLVKLTYD
jgi:hypothetical protein